MCDGAGAPEEADRERAAGGVSLEQYRTIVNAIDDGIYRLDADNRFVAINDAALEQTGYARRELFGEHVSVVLDEYDAARLEWELRERLETGEDADATFDLAIETADGGRLLCEVQFSVLEADGEFDGVVAVVQDVDEASERDWPDSAWETDESISSVIDDADVGVFVLDEAFDIVWADETVETYFGVDRDEVIGRDKRTVIEETIRDRLAEPEGFAETVLATYDDNTSVEQFECRITDGPDREERWLEHRSKPIESGRYAGGRVELYYDITDRKESERARRESERRFESLVDAVDEYAIFMLDPGGRVRSWNRGAKRIKGYDASEIVGEHFSTFYTDDRADDVPERNLERAKTEGTVENEGWRVRADGSRFWASVTITAIWEDGELQGYAKVTRDMTERREREQQLQRERDLVERILETSPVGIAVVNPDGSTNRANERMATLLDLSPEESAAYTAGQRDMYDKDGRLLPVEQRPASRVFETGEPISDREIRLDRADGGRTWLSINATPIGAEEGPPEQVVVTATEITDLKELAERRKRELEEREKELAAVKLATNLLETGDRPIEELLEEFVSQLPQSFRYPERTAARVSFGDREAATETTESFERTITSRTSTANGTPVTIDVGFAGSPPEGESDPFIDEERELIDTLATLAKFHFERREYIDELRAETRRLEQFAHAASHDLQEPLRMVSSYLQLIERRYADELDEDGREFLAFALEGAERMRSMTDGLLAYARVKTRGKPLEPVDLEAVFENARSDLEGRIVATGTDVTADPLPTVEGDENQLRQVFQNLLDNAIEYSDDTPRIHVSAERRGSEWKISVRDEGIGIPADEREQIFEMFQRLHGRGDHDGTGIGLALCERIVERHGGTIEVDSEPGEGSTFSVTLPAVDD